MVQRIVLIKLQAPFDKEEGRREVAVISHNLLPQVPGVTSVEVGTPAEESCEESWDLVLKVSFANIDAVEPYRVHPVHLEYRDAIADKMEVLKAWNFQFD